MKKKFIAPSVEIKKADLNAFLITASISVSDTPTNASAPVEASKFSAGSSFSSSNW